MKKIYLLVVALLCLSLSTHAQVPEQFNYQTVVRDANGSPLALQQISMRISILSSSNKSKAVYSEVHRVTTNSFGLVNLIVGSGSQASSSFASIDWSVDNYYIQTELDPNGGSNYHQSIMLNQKKSSMD